MNWKFLIVLSTGIITQLNYKKLYQTGNNLGSLRRNVPLLLMWFLQQVSHKKYWVCLLKNTPHQDKSITLCQWKNGAPVFVKANTLLCGIDTCFSFWFIKYMIGAWTTDLSREVSSTTKLINWLGNSASKRKLVTIT